VDHVVHLPYGAHPTFSSLSYGVDEEHLRLYVGMCRDGKTQDYLDEYIYGPEDHFDYLERVGGMRKMTELKNMLSLT
jgi:hypothetical protein